MVVFSEIDGVKWWPLVIGVLWKMNREDRDEREHRDEKTERERSMMRKEKTGIK